MAETYKIIELRAENFKRLTAVQIRPDGGLVQITGRNGSGKSSCLDAVWAAMGGKEAAPAVPIKKGQKSATVFVDIGDVRVTRKWTDKGTTLVVENAAGMIHRSPQAVLDDLVGKLTFDPLKFMNMKDKEQATLLRELVGLDTSKIDQERQQVFDQRTHVNKLVKAATVIVDTMPHHADAPEALVSTGALVKQHREAHGRITENGKARKAHAQAQAVVVGCEKDEARIRAQLATAEAATKEAKATEVALTEQVAALADPDLAPIELAMDAAEETNLKVTANTAREEKNKELAKLKAEVEAQCGRLADIDVAKAALLAAAAFPVPGLAVDGDIVMLNGVPISQASSAEQIKIALAISAALNPKLRVVMIRDGSLLDSAGLAEVAAWCQSSGMQCLMERVADEGERTGIVISDGHVLAPDEVEVPFDAAPKELVETPFE